MLYHSRRRLCRQRALMLYCVSIVSFVVLWCFFTVVILVVQDSYLRQPSAADYDRNVDDDSYMGRGVQVVVGHYNGNLPKEKAANLTKGKLLPSCFQFSNQNCELFISEQLNANNYEPMEGVGEDGRGVRLSASDDRLAEVFSTATY